MKLSDYEIESKVAELERAFQMEAGQCQAHVQGSGASVYDLVMGEAGKRKKTKLSSVLLGVLAGSLMLCAGWDQVHSWLGNVFEQKTQATSAPPAAAPVAASQDAFDSSSNVFNDPHTIEGTAAIHKEMQSGTVNVAKSTITGIVDSKTMTASLYWTFVLKNNNSSDKEASIIIDLPKNSALSRATLWINGVAQEAAFSSNGQVQNAYDSIVVRHRDPLLVTQIAPNRIKVLAAPVTANGGTMQFRLGITAPAEHNSNGDFVRIPEIAASNLEFDGTQDIHITSETKIGGIGKTERSGIYTLRANLTQDKTDGAKIKIKSGGAQTFATRLTHTYPQEFVKAELVDGELELTRVKTKPACAIINDNDAAFRLSNLWAHQEIEKQAASGKINEACNIANVYRIVSSVSGATVLEENYDYETNGLNRDMYRVLGRSSSSGNDFRTLKGFVPYSAGNSNSAAPMLQGATFGTIGPMADANVIAGVNTAGTVRVNNLANLEVLFNIIAYLFEAIGVAVAVFLVSEAAVNGGLKRPFQMSRRKTLLLGLVIATLALVSRTGVYAAFSMMRDGSYFC